MELCNDGKKSVEGHAGAYWVRFWAAGSRLTVGQDFAYCVIVWNEGEKSPDLSMGSMSAYMTVTARRVVTAMVARTTRAARDIVLYVCVCT